MSRTARIGAAWLFGMGIVILGVVVYGIASSRWACDTPPEYSGYQMACDLAWVFGAVGVVGAALHMVAARSIWRGRLRGALAGVVISLLGLYACTGFLEDERWWVVPPVAVGYTVTLLALVYMIIRGRPRPGWDTAEARHH